MKPGAKKFFFVIIVIVSIFGTFLTSLIGVRADVFAKNILFVDFGATETENTYGFNDWRTPIVSSHSAYISVNEHTGVHLVSGTSQWDGYQGGKGATPFMFQEGDLIKVTWYNSSSTTKKFKNLPLISFEDPDKPVDQTGEPQWYVMKSGVEKVAPGEQFETYFVSKSYEGEGVSASAGEHTLVNVTFNNIDHDIICEKIEYIPAEQARPTQSTHLTAMQNSHHPDSKVDLTWDRSTGVLDMAYYRIYRNGIWIYKTEDTQFIVPLLEYSTEYTFTITAVDIAGNESLHSSVATIKIAEFQGRNDLIYPQKDITYLGAFRLPSVADWGYKCGGISYYPAGDPNNIDGDAYPGSLYAFGHIREQKVAKISIPEPCIAKNYTELPRSQMLSDFHEVRPEN